MTEVGGECVWEKRTWQMHFTSCGHKPTVYYDKYLFCYYCGKKLRQDSLKYDSHEAKAAAEAAKQSAESPLSEDESGYRGDNTCYQRHGARMNRGSGPRAYER